MPKFVYCLLVAALCAITAGCGSPVEAPDTSLTTLPPATAGTVEQLIGTDWIVGDMVVSFKDAGSLVVRGGVVDEMAPDGVQGSYTVTNGNVEVLVEIMGEQHVRRGTWDGERLVVDGTPAIRQ